MFRKACTVTHAYSGVIIAGLYLCYPHRVERLASQFHRAGVKCKLAAEPPLQAAERMQRLLPHAFQGPACGLYRCR